MANAPPIPETQRGSGKHRPDISMGRQTRHERRLGVAGDDIDPGHQGDGANIRQNTHRSGKTQDR